MARDTPEPIRPAVSPPAETAPVPHEVSPAEYYERLAPDYDASRFANSYGQYLEAQERHWLTRWLSRYRNGAILDLACGTGRLLDFATHGLDLSPAMLREAALKHPHKSLHCRPATEVARLGVTFDAVFSLHLAMHLAMPELSAIIAACQGSVRRGGALILDAPSARRRRLVGFHASGWHGSTALNAAQLADLAGPGWRLIATRGLMFFPVHRMPTLLRSWVRPVDTLLGVSPIKSLASYNLFLLQRQ